MDLHFISTGKDFPYLYYIAVISALKTQWIVDPYLWITQEPGGRYYHRIKDRVITVKANVPDFPSLAKKSEHFKQAHIKDYITWNVLYEYGGVCMDLDTFSLKDLTTLLLSSDKEVVTTPYIKAGLSLFPFNSAVVLAKPKSLVIKEALDESTKALMSKDILWGQSGPIAFSIAIQRHYDLVYFIKPGTFGEVVTDFTKTLDVYREEGILEPNARVLHLYASTYEKIYYNIGKSFIADSNILLARLIKQTLSEDEWNV